MKTKKIFLYVNYTPYDLANGISKKIKSQISALRNLGFDVTYTGYIEDGSAVFDNQDEIIYEKKFKFKNKKYRRLSRRFLLINTAQVFVDTINAEYDYFYLRWHAFDTHFIRLLKTMKKSNSKIIVEAHAYTPNRKITNMFDFYSVFVDKLYSKKAKEYIDVVAGISEFNNIWGINTIKIENGISVDSLPVRNWNKQDHKIRLLCVAFEKKYHGYDRLLQGLHNYKESLTNKPIKIEIKMVGEYSSKTKNLIKKLDLSDEVVLYGKKSGKELEEIYNNSDIGIGALAHHRVGMYSGSSLKTKEYCAMGLPFIYGWEEPAFKNDFPFGLQVPLNENPINIVEVIDFYNDVQKYPNMLKDMRKFARENFSWENQFLKIF